MSFEFADRVAIENLIGRYARHVDCAEYESLGQMFVHGQISANQPTAPLVAAEAVRRFYSTTNRTHADGTARTHHIITNLEFEPASAGVVNVRSCFTVLQGTATLPLQPIVCGRYQDVFEKAAGVWRFRSKHIEVTLIGQMREHLTIDLT